MTPGNLTQLRRLNALRCLDLIPAVEIVTWASERVAYDDDLLRLAALSPTSGSSEIDYEARLALLAAGSEATTEESAARLVARDVATSIRDGVVEPIAGARQLWSVARRVPQVEPELRAFVGMASEWEDSAEFRSQYDVDIVECARRYIEPLQYKGDKWIAACGDC